MQEAVKRYLSKLVRWLDNKVPDNLSPAPFEGSNLRFGEPEGWDAVKSGECSVLHTQEVNHKVILNEEGVATSYIDLPNTEYQSLWVLTWQQRLKMLFTGKVWFVSIGFQTPVCLSLARMYDPSEKYEYDPEPHSDTDAEYVKAILDRYRGIPLDQLTVDDCRTLISTYGDPLRVLPEEKNMQDDEWWQIQFQATLSHETEECEEQA